MSRRPLGPPAAPGDNPVEGVLLVDKPVGLSSHGAVAAVRRALGGVKAGHAGTLDPFASGLLVVLVGAGTRMQRRLLELPKRYETVALLGARSSTGDPEGEITVTGRLPPGPPQLVVGEIRQRPPRHSAVKIRGERAYRKARRGESFEMPERIVTVYSFRELWREEPVDGVGRAGYEIECSSGTYVRSLIADLDDAYCLELRRTSIGPFSVEEAIGLPARGEQLEAGQLLELGEAQELIERAARDRDSRKRAARERAVRDRAARERAAREERP